jgi:hypothetical protein
MFYLWIILVQVEDRNRKIIGRVSVVRLYYQHVLNFRVLLPEPVSGQEPDSWKMELHAHK